MKLFKSILLLACAFTFSFGEDYKELNSKTMIGMESGLSNI
jgi:hypothetical protein